MDKDFIDIDEESHSIENKIHQQITRIEQLQIELTRTNTKLRYGYHEDLRQRRRDLITELNVQKVHLSQLKNQQREIKKRRAILIEQRRNRKKYTFPDELIQLMENIQHILQSELRQGVVFRKHELQDISEFQTLVNELREKRDRYFLC